VFFKGYAYSSITLFSGKSESKLFTSLFKSEIFFVWLLFDEIYKSEERFLQSGTIYFMTVTLARALESAKWSKFNNLNFLFLIYMSAKKSNILSFYAW